MTTPAAEIRCPFCAFPGWRSTRWFAAYSAECGTAWGDDGFTSQSEPCRMIERLRMDLGLNQLLKETA
jgi:hypothetical protein